MLPAFALALLALSGAARAEDPLEDWSLHGQATVVSQAHPEFDAAYTGPNSLSAKSEDRTSFTTTAFLGRRLWSGAELYVNPEGQAGLGLSGTHGIAGFPNGEIYRVDTPGFNLNLSRAYLRQTIGLSGDSERVESGQNRLAGELPAERVAITVGKFSLVDFLDDNAYATDARTQFLNWALFANAAWDYAADTRGYTWGVYAEYVSPGWAVRAVEALVPKVANGETLETDITKARGSNLEGEVKYAVLGHPGAARLLAWMNQADMGNYRETLDTAGPADVTRTRSYRTKYGFGLNFQQELTPDLGLFSRLGWQDGRQEAFIFTEADETASLGLSLKGSGWGRKSDVCGLAGIVNGLSTDHRDYLAAGGVGFILGDGALNYGTEDIVEAYYLASLAGGFSLTLDFQEVEHPGYNRDRGPASIFGVRLHWEL